MAWRFPCYGADMSAEEREYLVCVDNTGKNKHITKGKIYIILTKKQQYPEDSDGNRPYYSFIGDGGKRVTLYGYRFKKLQVKGGDR
jgi:hypothetical protein